MNADTVYDTKTTLTWQRAVPQSTYSWSGAISYCGSLNLSGGGWRLPNMKELQTIVDETRSNPPIDETAFPNTPVGWYWTSSPYLTSAWYVNFANGDVSYSGANNLVHVRCVR